VRTRVLTFFASFAVLVATSSSNVAVAGPPMTGSSKSDGDSSWLDAVNPKQWSLPTMPAMPWSEERPRIQKKSKSMISSMSSSAKNGWAKTKNALDPRGLFEADPKVKSKGTKSTGRDTEEGFFGGLFKPEEKPKEIKTVNDFLSQPHPN